MKLHILRHQKRRTVLIAALDSGTIEMSDEMWRGEAGDMIVGEVPQDDDASDYRYAGTVRDYI